MNIIGKRKIWYSISLILIVPGLISLIMFHLKLGIDFTGGSQLEVQGSASSSQISAAAGSLGLQDVSTVSAGSGHWLIQYRDPAAAAKAESDHQQFKALLANQGLTEISFDSVGPSISGGIARDALLAIAVASLAIVCYVALAFRNAPPPVSPWSFGITAIIALLHDAFFVLVFSRC